MLDLFGLDGTGGEFRVRRRVEHHVPVRKRVEWYASCLCMVRIVKLFKWKNSRDERKEEQDEEEDIAAQPSKVSRSSPS